MHLYKNFILYPVYISNSQNKIIIHQLQFHTKAMQQQNLSAKQKKALAALTFESSTMDLLKRIELRMEMLTQELERLPEEKVKIAQRVRFYIDT